MIQIILNYANEVVICRIQGHKVEFGSTITGAVLGTIDGIKLDYTGTIREFPDLQNDIDWRNKAILRFKEHLKKLQNEEEISKYIIKELRYKGYTPKIKQKDGQRPIRIQ